MSPRVSRPQVALGLAPSSSAVQHFTMDQASVASPAAANEVTDIEYHDHLAFACSSFHDHGRSCHFHSMVGSTMILNDGWASGSLPVRRRRPEWVRKEVERNQGSELPNGGTFCHTKDLLHSRLFIAWRFHRLPCPRCELLPRLVTHFSESSSATVAKKREAAMFLPGCNPHRRSIVEHLNRASWNRGF